MTSMDEFSTYLANAGLSTEQITRVAEFRDEVLREDEVQNLTRLLSPKDFFEGHVVDVLELEKSNLLKGSALDIGAGMGVPGFLHQLIFHKSTPQNAEYAWVSSDSERMKADFVARMIERFGLKGISATSERAESYLSNHEVDSVVARAVGPVSRIYNWLRLCSTWNYLLLFKGPKWDEEWAEFQRTGQRNKLEIISKHEYLAGTEQKQRKIVLLKRKN